MWMDDKQNLDKVEYVDEVHTETSIKSKFLVLFTERYSWTKPPGGGTCRRGWFDVSAELAELALVNQVDQLNH